VATEILELRRQSRRAFARHIVGDLEPATAEVLLALYVAEPLSGTETAQRLELNRTTVVHGLSALKQRALAREGRRRGQHRQYELTDAGRFAAVELVKRMRDAR
jgi:DNA-binding transcriptional ArsR family regulator